MNVTDAAYTPVSSMKFVQVKEMNVPLVPPNPLRMVSVINAICNSRLSYNSIFSDLTDHRINEQMRRKLLRERYIVVFVG